ncbi:unnamed protein product, partial [marine sediment metagenome]
LIFLPILMGAEMYWTSENFDPISLPNITSRNNQVSDSSSLILTTSGDAEISANNNVAAQLSCTDTLVTEYKLTFDNVGGTTGIGTGEDGGSEWQLYSVFLTTGTEGNVTHVPDDNDVEVTLYVRASNNPDEVSDSDTYNATQTLTVTWVGP